MFSTVGSHALARRSFVLTVLLAAHTACGGIEDRRATTGPLDAALPPVWAPEVTVNTCEDFASVGVGNYVIASNYWNKAVCPGTQCMEINTATGAFSVTQGPPPCGESVASYPNVLYGCSYGNCSPKTILPKQVGTVTSMTSSWDFSVGAASNDRWNVSYDIWFCPDANCGASGFPKGLELMIWLDYKNAKGWKDHLGTVDIGGYTWDVWVADMAAGGAVESWKYMNYIVKGPAVTSVTDLDLNAFVKDAVARGYVKSYWFLYAIQAGMEVRSGGMPFTSNSFSVTVNGVTGSTAPLPYEGPSCDGGIPPAEGMLVVKDKYVTAGSLHGYAYSWATPGKDSTAIACGSLTASPSALCTAGSITADTTYASTAGLGFNLNQAVSVAAGTGGVDGGALGVDGGAVQPGTITIPTSITVSVTKSGTLSGNASLRAQLTDDKGKRFCYGGSMAEAIPIGKFNTQCWNNKGEYATATTAFRSLEIMVPSSASTEQEFSYCLTNISVQ